LVGDHGARRQSIIHLAGDVVGSSPVAVLHRIAGELDQHVVEALKVCRLVFEIMLARSEILSGRVVIV
jgi:hypothetical protein